LLILVIAVLSFFIQTRPFFCLKQSLSPLRIKTVKQMLTTLNQGLLNVVSIVIRLVIAVSHKHLNSCYGGANIGNAKIFFAFIKVAAGLIEKLNVKS